jgi:hypothetical protein
MFRILMKVSSICFATSDPKISYKVFLNVHPLPRYDRCPELLPLMPLMAALSFLKYSGRLPPMPFLTLLLPWRVHSFFLSAPTLWVPCSSVSLIQLFVMMFLLRHATLARRDTFLQAAANFLRHPQSLRVS